MLIRSAETHFNDFYIIVLIQRKIASKFCENTLITDIKNEKIDIVFVWMNQGTQEMCDHKWYFIQLKFKYDDKEAIVLDIYSRFNINNDFSF